MEPTADSARSVRLGSAPHEQGATLMGCNDGGALLRSRRIAAGLKQTALAALLGLPPQRLSEYERGQKKIPDSLWDTAERILAEARPAPLPLAGAPRQERGVQAHPLTAVRRAHGWTRADLARRLADVVGGSGDASKVGRWERSGVVPDMPTQHALADLLRVPRQQMATRPWPGWLPAEGADVEWPWTRQGTLASLDATVGEAVMDRRGFLTMSTAAIAGVTQRWSAVPSPVLGKAFAGGSVGDLVRAFEGRLSWLRTRQDELGGGAALDLLDAELRTATVMLRQSLGPAAGRRMSAVAAELARLAGWAGVDAGRAAAAERYFVTGLRAAYDAGDGITGANIIKSWSLLLVESGRPRDAQMLMATARQATEGAPPRVQAMLRVREARVQAALGNSSGCDALLGQSAHLLQEGLHRDDHPATVTYFGPAELQAQTAACHQLLGRPARAQAALEGSLVLVDVPSRRIDRTTYQLWRGEAAASQGEVERACALLSDALPGVAEGSSARNRAQFAAARDRLNRHADNPAVRTLDEQSRALIR